MRLHAERDEGRLVGFFEDASREVSEFKRELTDLKDKVATYESRLKTEVELLQVEVPVP